MKEALPYGEIRFCDENEKIEISEEFFSNQGKNLRDNDPVGYILEVKKNCKNVLTNQKIYNFWEYKTFTLIFISSGGSSVP